VHWELKTPFLFGENNEGGLPLVGRRGGFWNVFFFLKKFLPVRRTSTSEMLSKDVLWGIFEVIGRLGMVCTLMILRDCSGRLDR